ncbi:DNA internalization-related competence protein ComEC/Rec2 [bacterium]|nr:DNA internalization-related competence protein ComEC/Rec2 [bacterium]
MHRAPAMKTALLVSAGILIADWSRPVLLWPCALLMALCGLVCLIIRRPGMRGILLPLSLLCLGAFRLDQFRFCRPADHIGRVADGRTVTIRARLVRDPEIRPERTRFWLAADSILAPDASSSMSGCFLASDYDHWADSLRYGDEIMCTGRLETPPAQRNPGGFDYRAFLMARRIYGLMRLSGTEAPVFTGINRGHPLKRFIIYPLRRWMAGSLEKIDRGPALTLMKAPLLGDRTDLLPETRDMMARAGIIHILAVSGLHVGFVLFILQTIFGMMRLPRTVAAGLVITGLTVFALITESSPPVIRATVMASVYLIGRQAERDINPLNIIGLAALILLLVTPQMLFDPGFQLSFLAVLSIVILYPRWQLLPGFRQCHAFCMRQPGLRGIWTLFLVSLSAQAGTLPVVLSSFYRLPVLGILTNLAAVPLTGIIVALGFTSLLVMPVSPWTAGLYGLLNHHLAGLLLALAHAVQSLPFASIDMPCPGVFQILFYLTALTILFSWHDTRKRKWHILAGLVLCNVWIWHSAMTSATNRLIYAQLDVGQGDAAVLHLPRHRTVIIDGGDRQPLYDAGTRVLVPYLRKKQIRTIDAVICTHAHNDHAGGLIAVLSAFKVKQVILADTLTRYPPMQHLIEIIRKKQVPVHMVRAPDSLILPGTGLYFLAPDSVLSLNPNVNNRSVVTHLVFGKNRWLFMGDAEADAEARLLDRGILPEIQILKIGHHGSATSSTLRFLSTVRPGHAVISVGNHNRFRHPSPKTVGRLNGLGINVHRTDREGAVIFTSDGSRFQKQHWQRPL